MRTFSLTLVLLSVFALLGCQTYHYKFTTVIDENGGVEREVEFYIEQHEKEEDPETGEEVEPEQPVDFSEDMVIPAEKRFYFHKRSPGRFHGRWRSEGKIHDDFRWKLVVPENALITDEQENVRFAYNEGRIIVQDFILVKSITYVERFHDYFSKDELDTNLNTITDIVIDIALAAIESDLGKGYDLRALKDYTNKTVLPFLKRWNSVVFHMMFCMPMEFEVKTLFDDPVSEELLKIAYDLMQLGVIENIHFDHEVVEEVEEDIKVWIVEKLHDLVTSKENGDHIPIEEVERYLFDDGGFHKGFEEEIKLRYGTVEAFGELMGSSLSSFATALAFFSPSHAFEHEISMPGSIIYVFPEPTKDKENSDEDKDETGREAVKEQMKDDANIIKWDFSDMEFYPDGVILTITSVMPLEENQKRLLRRVRLKEPDEIKEYVSVFLSLSKSQRESLLDALRYYMEEGSTEKLEALDWDEKIMAIMEYFKDTKLRPLIEKKAAEAEEEESAEDTADDDEQED